MEQGTGGWQAPRFHIGTSIVRPTNVSSGKRYRGLDRGASRLLYRWRSGPRAAAGAQVDGYERPPPARDLTYPTCQSMHCEPAHQDRIRRVGSLPPPVFRHHAAVHLISRRRATPRHSMPYDSRAGHAAVRRTGLTAIFPAASGQRPMPPKKRDRNSQWASPG
ncbi:hypothetical protein QN219_27235 [Sinorhizobium sp. 7-81]|nr:hypothetical protein [Sinorhizobium sp. 8-89]